MTVSSRAESGRIERALSRMLGPLGPFEALPSGTGGMSFLVTAGGRRCVAKAFTPDAPVLLGPAEQFALLRVLADAGIAPAPRGFDLESRLLVVDYVADSAPRSADALRAPDSIAMVARLLRRLHAVSATLPPFAPASFAARYLDMIGGHASLTRADRERYDELVALAALPIPGDPCICHNDLTADNLLLGPSPRLIDFEYAVMGTPAVDLASLSVMNEFGVEHTERLLESYFGRRLPFTRAEFARVQRLQRLLAHFWALASAHSVTGILAQYGIDDD